MEQSTQFVPPAGNEKKDSYVVSHLTEALIKLLSEKPLNRISVSELCKNAGVGRTSFYRNFETKEEILKSYIRQIFTEGLKEYGSESDQLLSEGIRKIFTHFEKHRNFYTVLNERGLVYFLRDILLEIYGAKSGCTMEEAYAAAFFVYSLYAWIEVWFQRGMTDSVEDLVNAFKVQGL